MVDVTSPKTVDWTQAIDPSGVAWDPFDDGEPEDTTEWPTVGDVIASCHVGYAKRAKDVDEPDDG